MTEQDTKLVLDTMIKVDQIITMASTDERFPYEKIAKSIVILKVAMKKFAPMRQSDET